MVDPEWGNDRSLEFFVPMNAHMGMIVLVIYDHKEKVIEFVPVVTT